MKKLTFIFLVSTFAFFFASCAWDIAYGADIHVYDADTKEALGDCMVTILKNGSKEVDTGKTFENGYLPLHVLTGTGWTKEKKLREAYTNCRVIIEKDGYYPHVIQKLEYSGEKNVPDYIIYLKKLPQTEETTN